MKIRIGSPIMRVWHPDAFKSIIGRSLTDEEMKEINSGKFDKQDYIEEELTEETTIIS